MPQRGKSVEEWISELFKIVILRMDTQAIVSWGLRK